MPFEALPRPAPRQILVRPVQIAQTNLQLYNQLRRSGMPPREMQVVHRAYELLASLYPGYYQADGKPFVAHGVGVASVLAGLDQPAEIVAVGLLHNVYGNADFGDGREYGVTPARRRLVSDAVGARVEELLIRFRDLRIDPRTLNEVRRALPERDATERALILVDLADYLEKYVDLGVLYFGDGDWITDAIDSIGRDLVEIAEELGQPRLAKLLADAFDDAAREAADFPAELRPSDTRPYLSLVMPRSCRTRRSVVLRSQGRAFR
jgi:hypothetical protein